ncbi:MAG: transporter substrate-binding domain-containing protein [Burkholderiales bacterium]|nr:transporter substrate-binding domain-containing protein [Burkholderiales bacterium]
MRLLRFFLILCAVCLAASANGRDLLVHVSTLPPYVLNGARQGIACDIITRALASQNVGVRFVASNNKRMEIEVKNGSADAGFAGIPDDSSQVFFSDPVIEFENVAVTLRSRNLHIDGMTDFYGKRVIAFRNAARVLGPAFAQMARKNPDYSEVGDQHSQLPMLDADRGDVIILERRVFLYYSQALHGNQNTQDLYRLHRVFKPVSRLLGFHSSEQRDIFNKGLQTIRQNGEYTAILRSYMSE